MRKTQGFSRNYGKIWHTYDRRNIMTQTKKQIVLAVPKGRILKELIPMLENVGIIPEPAFFDDKARQLQFNTNIENLSIIRVRSFDVATFVAFGAAHLGVAGNDVLEEFDYDGIYAPVNLKIGACHLAVATLVENVGNNNDKQLSHIRIATKYPNLTRNFYDKKGVGTEIIKLNGAMELAPKMGMCNHIVDLVSTGDTMKENGLVEVEKLIDITSRLIVNRTALKTYPDDVQVWIEKFRAIIYD